MVFLDHLILPLPDVDIGSNFLFLGQKFAEKTQVYIRRIL
jgi:hypothetical protein